MSSTLTMTIPHLPPTMQLAPPLNSAWIRTLAGTSFRRADSRLDERAPPDDNAAERWLRNLAGYLPVARESHRHIRRFNAAITRHADMLTIKPDAGLAAHFHALMAEICAAPKPLAQEPRLAAVMACVGLAAKRHLGMWPHPVQFAGALVLLGGRLSEMQTGEGKSLVAAIAATVMAGSNASVHIISTNDYLARRDCEEMSPLFNLFGLSCGHIENSMDAAHRRHAYAQSICYVSGKELVFDYLKDRLAGHGTVSCRVSHLHGLQQSPDTPPPIINALHFAIVDEADSVLIDEARTPMILSRDAPCLYPPELMTWAIASARILRQGEHFRIDAAMRSVELLSNARAACLPMPTDLPPVWRNESWLALILRQALTALHLFICDQHYILVDGKVQIVDESTGRVMPDRSWEQGLHQLIETKENIALTSGRETLARMTFQRFFRRYYLLAGLSGTAAEAASELWNVYRMKVCALPPNRPNRRHRLPDVFLPTQAEQWHAVAEEACAASARGQPVLVGTQSVEASEAVSAEFARRGVSHVVLNARQDADEASVVAQAGQAGRITVATNMAGRGTDIKLDAKARSAGGLYVILTGFHESPRVDRQLFGRSGRQGEPGNSRAIVACCEGLPGRLALWIRRPLQSGNSQIQRKLLRYLIWREQGKAEKRAYHERMQTLKQDLGLNRMIGFSGKVL
jgi:preprotein translocase subunit SecA